ncbi:hypothetical protein H257_07059 [Aphanomyces astaci]|uniref:Uncharacterized protein n=1 Tax=Aphanomyces astaci TaxID=112090 RepID=W4GLQ8_APHAT|nr:hypothetical protein H257_07059 [Aphanomyces astaci]ETV79843.1 hypothetical protein H257_07059 [Aphanomyces astaci]|eukprot:XP_009830779.1 hypothetical protein H257_07059 [Aphanomyces astaci]
MDSGSSTLNGAVKMDKVIRQLQELNLASNDVLADGNSRPQPELVISIVVAPPKTKTSETPTSNTPLNRSRTSPPPRPRRRPAPPSTNANPSDRKALLCVGCYITKIKWYMPTDVSKAAMKGPRADCGAVRKLRASNGKF